MNIKLDKILCSFSIPLDVTSKPVMFKVKRGEIAYAILSLYNPNTGTLLKKRPKVQNIG